MSDRPTLPLFTPPRALGLALMLGACPPPGAMTETGDPGTSEPGTGDPASTGTGEPTPTTGDAPGTTGTPGDGPTSTTGPEHCGKITADEVWAPDLNPHVLTCDVLLEGGTLTIAPGTEVLAVDDVGLFVAKNGGTANLDVQGTADAPVRFAGQSGAAPGQWKGLGLYPAAGEVSLAHTTVEAGGGLNVTSAVFLDGAELRVDHLTVLDADEWGLDFRRGGRLTADSVGLQVHGTIGWPVRIDPNWADTLPAQDSDYSGNDNDGIYLENSGGDWREIDRSCAWEDLGVAYHAVDSLIVEGTAQASAVLTLQDGVTVKFAESAALAVATAGGSGGLITEGTAERPVTLTSFDSLDRGAWAGLELGDNADDDALRLVHTVIEWGGGFNSNACLTTESVELHVESVTLRGCEGAGFLLRSGSFTAGSAGLRVTDSDRVGEMQTPQVHTIPVDGLDLTGNDLDALSVVQPGAVKITAAVTWRELGVPYRIEDYIALEGTGNAPAVLTIEAGTTLGFVHGARIDLSRNGGASGLRAIGTADAPVIFTGADAFDPGAWSGIVIFGNSVDAETVIEHAEVRWGGGLNSDANIRITDASPTIRDSLIAGSDCWGIQSLQGAKPALSNLSFADNACGDVTP